MNILTGAKKNSVDMTGLFCGRATLDWEWMSATSLTIIGIFQEAWMQFEPLVNSYEFMFATPEGTTDILSNKFWNATDACCDFTGANVDDSGYLRALMDAVKAQVSVDERRVYFVGHSNGGFMSYRMACDHADAVAAIVSLSGATYFDITACTPSGPVHTLEVHGTADTTILYGGGNLIGVPYPGAIETTEHWATHDGCTLVPDNSAPNLDIDITIPGDETVVTRYVDACLDGGAAELWTIAGGPHSPALTPDWASLVAGDFESVVLSGVVAGGGLYTAAAAEVIYGEVDLWGVDHADVDDVCA